MVGWIETETWTDRGTQIGTSGTEGTFREALLLPPESNSETGKSEEMVTEKESGAQDAMEAVAVVGIVSGVRTDIEVGDEGSQ